MQTSLPASPIKQGTATLTRYAYTLRYLRPVQVYGRIWQKLFRPRPDLRPAPPRACAAGPWVTLPERKPAMTGQNTVTFLNVTQDVAGPKAWNGPAPEKLWLLNLHYFDDLVARDATSRRSWHQALIQRWIDENPPADGVGWEAYPLSLRIVNWIKWNLAGNLLSEQAVESLAVQARYLAATTEWSLLGNHLLANAKSLVFAGVFFSGGEAQQWLEQGLRLLSQELEEQILPDGGHFERSPMYHSIILEDLLDLDNLLRAYPAALPAAWQAFSSSWSETIQKMRRWLTVMTHPDGRIAFFNDSAWGIAPCPEELHTYAARLGYDPSDGLSEAVTTLADSGYIRMQMGPAILLVDIGEIGPDYIPGHAHADTLSFELSLFGQRAIVNSGTSTYKTFPDRQRQRGSVAHNTVTVDGLDSSEVWGAFRVARRARTYGLEWGQDGDGFSVSCSHDGYRRLPGRVTHTRTWRLSATSLAVVDCLEGRFTTADVRFHLHPDAAPARAEPDSASRFLVGSRRVTWRTDCTDHRIEASSFHPSFGVTEQNQCLTARIHGGSAATHTTHNSLDWS